MCMTIYNGVVGIDEPALNTFVQSVYQVTHDKLLKGNVPVDAGVIGVSSIDYDIAAAPQVSLTPSVLVRELRRSIYSAIQAADNARAEEAADAQSRASFTLDLPQLVIGVNFRDGSPTTQIQASASAGLELIVDSTGNLTPDLVTMAIQIPSNPALAEIVNRALVPELIDLIEQNFLQPIRIPPLGVGSLQVSPPVVVTGNGRLLATTAILPTVADPAPLDGSWPVGRAFVAVDSTVVSQLLNNLVAGKVIADHWEKTFKILFFSVTVKADYEVRVSEINLQVVPGQDGQLSGTARLDLMVHLHAKNVGSFTATGTATPQARVSVSISQQNELTAKLDGLDGFTLQLDFQGVPAIFDGILSDILNALAPQITAAVNAAVAALPAQPIVSIPPINITVEGDTFVITLKNLDVTTIETDGKTLLGVTGEADVQTAQPVVPPLLRVVQPELVLVGTRS
jgi:hypothetical protein